MSAVCTAPPGIMEPYFASAWGVPGADYDQLNYGGEVAQPLDDQLLVKPDPNQPARPLHTYMAPLSLDNQAVAAVVRPPSPPPSKKIDMRLAQPGTEESKPGYLTPLASYTGELWSVYAYGQELIRVAQTFWYFWYADMFSQSSSAAAAALVNRNRRMSEDILSSTSRPFDSEGRARHPIPINPNLPFCQFVFSVLHSTQVSFSVTILALMYTYKYKKILALGQRQPFPREVSEAQGFVTGLMLANKYLDDNTYTNTTWAQFLGMPVKDVNDYELEWLDALEFNLCVSTSEFETWRSMLDAHVRSRERGDNATLSGSSFVFPQPGARARSASPPLPFYNNGTSCNQQALKRSAKDAFSADVLHNAGMYEAARLGPRKASLVASQVPVTALPTPAPSVPSISPTTAAYPTLARSSSLNRQIARLPVNGQRSSAGQEQMAHEVADLRQAAMANNWGAYQQVAEPIDFAHEDRWRMAPVQPRLYFLQAAATPQFGPDPRYHKAIPHYLDSGYGSAFDYANNPYAMAAAAAAAQEVMDVDQGQVELASPTDAMYANTQPQQDAMHPIGQPPSQVFRAMTMPNPVSSVPTHFANPQPAPFANAGPPGYAYGWEMAQPQAQPVWARQHAWRPGHGARWSSGSDDAFMAMHSHPMSHAAAMSQWSTPTVHASY